MTDPWAALRRYVRLDEGHCLGCISEATGIRMFPPGTEANLCERHELEVEEARAEAEQRHAEWEASRSRCEHCGSVLGWRRSDARFCSSRCRVAAHRARTGAERQRL